jgi:hypothetical protein
MAKSILKVFKERKKERKKKYLFSKNWFRMWKTKASNKYLKMQWDWQEAPVTPKTRKPQKKS